MISVTILTKNSEKYLRDVLKAVEGFPEVVVYDTGSTDGTRAIACSFSNVAWHEGPFEGFGRAHNKASELASHEWILSIDSDEVVTPALKKEVETLLLDAECVYSVSRQNFYRGKWIRGCGWWPDRVVRLYHRGKTAFSDRLVHEAVKTEGMKVCLLLHPLRHYPYAEISDFLRKMQHYSDLHAEGDTKKASIWKAFFRGIFAFFKSFILKRGFLDGQEGFLISVYNGQTTFYKYLKVWERSSPPKI